MLKLTMRNDGRAVWLAASQIAAIVPDATREGCYVWLAGAGGDANAWEIEEDAPVVADLVARWTGFPAIEAERR